MPSPFEPAAVTVSQRQFLQGDSHSADCLTGFSGGLTEMMLCSLVVSCDCNKDYVNCMKSG